MVRITSLGSVTTLLSDESGFDSGSEIVSTRPTSDGRPTAQIAAASINSSRFSATATSKRGVDEGVGTVVGP
ncbi:hypothetical protein [Halostagnicola kamekurae]|uniref:hypothetical protein n=1 Tax=Halostagnicola kamekurae TaxID=619731 RepID=UPI000B898861|nr:hypothetical protein [Halostagnicola kamekurae]